MRCSAYYKRGIRRRFLLAFLRFPVPEPGYRHGFRRAKRLNPVNPVDSMRSGLRQGSWTMHRGKLSSVPWVVGACTDHLALVTLHWSCRLVIHALFISRNLT